MYSMAVARSRLSCADPTEQSFWTMPTWRRDAPDGARAMLRDVAEYAFSRYGSLDSRRVSDVSMFMDLHISSLRQLEQLVKSGEPDDVSVLYARNLAPEQIDPRSLIGHFCGCLKHGGFIVKSVSGRHHGNRICAELIHKAMTPDQARVRYVDSNAMDATADIDGPISRLLMTSAFGGIPGSEHLTSVEDRLAYWEDPARLVDLILRRLTKRGILMCIADAVSKLPCALVEKAVRIKIIGSVGAALFSVHPSPRSSIRAEVVPGDRPLPASPPAAKLVSPDPDLIRRCVPAFGRWGSSAVPTSKPEMDILRYTASRSGSVYIRESHCSVRSDHLTKFGVIAVNFCTMCHSLHGVSATKVSKAQRVYSVFSKSHTICSGCGSNAVVRLDVTGRVLDVMTPKGRALIAPCGECGVVGPIAATYGHTPYCSKHAKDPAVSEFNSAPSYCAICDTFVHGVNDSAAIECEDTLCRVCIQCHSLLPTERWTKNELSLLRSRRGSKA